MADAKLEILLVAKDMAAKAFDAVNGRIDRLTRGVGALHTGLIAIAGGVTLAGTLAAFNNLTDAASDLEETVNKVNTIFGQELGETLSAWADDAATSMGLAKQEALDAASSLGYMFDQLGADRTEAVGLSQDMVQLAADIASFHNVAGGANKVLEDMQSAFRGEYDPIQKYIYTINAAAVQQEALARTGKSSANELTALDKAMATVAIVTRDAGKAQGDFARTSGQLANQQRILEGNLKDLRAELGERLLPAKTQIIQKINDWIKVNDKLLRQDLPKMFENLATALVSLIKPASEVAKYMIMIASAKPQYEDVYQLLDKAGKFASAGLLDWSEINPENLGRLRELVDMLDKTVRLTEGGEIRYKIGVDTEGFDEFKADYEHWIASLYAEDATRPVSPLPLIPALPTAPPSSGQLGSVSDWLMVNAPGDEADQAYRDIERMLDQRNQLFEQSNRELTELTQRTAWEMQGAMSDLFFDAITGELKSTEDYVRSFLESLARMASEALAQILLQKALGEAAGASSGSGYGWVGALANLAVNLASRDSGGPVAPGGMYEIGVPEILHAGGKQYLMMGGNQGGYVEPLNEAGQGGQNIRIINAVDPSLVEEWANSPSGEQVIMNIIRRNQ